MLATNHAERRLHGGQRQVVVGVGQHPFGQRQGIAHAAIGSQGDGGNGIDIGPDRLFLEHMAKVIGDLALPQAAQVEALAARTYGQRQLLRLGRRQHEKHPRRRLLEGLQQRVEGALGEHVRLVDDIDFGLQ